MRKLLFVPALALAAATMAGTAYASSEDAATVKPQANWMTKDQITKKLTSEGYKVRQVKLEGKGYEVYAIGKDGKRLEGLLDPVTGKLTGRETKEEN